MVAAGTVFLAGQTAPGRRGPIVGGGIVAQFEKALTNLLTALAGRRRPRDLASMTVYAVDMGDYRPSARDRWVWRRLVGADYPAMAGIGVTRLWDAEALVEVQGFAVLP